MASNRDELTVRGYFKNLAKIADFIARAALAAGLDERAAYAVQMAVDEACTNIIEHSYGGEGRGRIRLCCQVQATGLEITIYDQGRPFEPDQIPQPDTAASLAERPLGGLGLFLMRKLVDTVDFEFNTPHGNRLILFKRRGADL
ncbi:MAG: ATP-binding protein [Chloroflexota bacterium]